MRAKGGTENWVSGIQGSLLEIDQRHVTLTFHLVILL